MEDMLAQEEAKKKQLLAEKQDEKAKRRAAEEEQMRKDGDYEALLKSAKEREQEWENKFTQLNKRIEQKEIRTTAIRIANNMNPIDGDAAETIADYLEKQMALKDGNLIFLDEIGNPSVMDERQFKEAALQKNKFKPLLAGSKATGGGALGNPNAHTAPKKFSDYSEAELIQLRRNNPEEYKKLL
jgi:hypothetical protein